MTICNGMCVSAADIGVGGIDQIAYPHPICPAHGESPDHKYKEAWVHKLHDGPMGVCECGAYRDEHKEAA